jgi:hypothetical protein
MNSDVQQIEPSGARYARIVLACAARALLLFMGWTVVKALRNYRPETPTQPAPRRVAKDSNALNTSALRTLNDEHFTVGFPADVDKSDAAAVLRTLNQARNDIARRLTAAQLSTEQVPHLGIVLHNSTGDFTVATGQPWWAAAATKGNRIELQPVEVLRNRGVLETTLRHEYAHAVIESLGHGKTPRWLAEGLAITLAGEGPRYAELKTNPALSTDEIDRRLAALGNPGATTEEMRAAYGAAYRAIQNLIHEKTEPAVWKTIAAR